MRNQTRIIIAGMMGNLIETFDISICSFLSIYLAKYLIDAPESGVMLIFITFFAGYLARPIGALCLGLMSDHYGRKAVLALSILSMGIATALIGVIPSNLGEVSLYTLLVLRIIQSFSCGSEHLNSSIYLVENAEPGQKGYLGSWGVFGSTAGKFVASLAALCVSSAVYFFPQFEWLIWRIPFMLALLGSSIGLYVRLLIPESLEYVLHYAENPKPKFTTLLKLSLRYLHQHQLKSIYVFMLTSLGVSTTFLIYTYGPIQCHLYGQLSDKEIIISNLTALLLLMLLYPLLGKLSDKLEREKIIAYATVGLMLFFYPFSYYLSSDTLWKLVIAQCVLSVPAAAYYATISVMLAEMFPLELRCTVLSILYSAAASLSVGLTPLIAMVLTKHTGTPTAPTLLVILLGGITLTLMSRFNRFSRVSYA